MKPLITTTIPLLLLPLLLSLPPTTPSVISSTRNRLPMSLSSIISDLEAEGCHHLSTATFLTSRSVPPSSRRRILHSLVSFSSSDTDDHDREPTAFGKKLGTDDEHGIGVAIANPRAGSHAAATAGAIASTVVATHGTIIFVVSRIDLEREEGLFDDLAPAVERLLNIRGREEVHRAGELIVIFLDEDEDDEVDAAPSLRRRFEAVAANMLRHIVQDGTRERMEDVFDSVEYLTSRRLEDDPEHGLIETLVEGEGQLLEPADAAAAVAAAVALGMIDPFEEFTKKSLDAVDLAAMRKIGAASLAARERVASVIAEATGDGEEEEEDVTLVNDFGALCTAAIKSAMKEFDDEVGPLLLSKSAVAKRKRADLIDELVASLEEAYDDQLKQLRVACFENFRKELSKLRVGPNLSQDMTAVASESVATFGEKVKKLRVQGIPNTWLGVSTAKSRYRRELTEFCKERLDAAKLSGAYRPLPRKGVTVGLHWLLPKPFGNDYRQAATDVYRGDLVYTPKGKVTEVDKEEVLKGTGDWRNTIVPVPGAPDMMYQPGTQ